MSIKNTIYSVLAITALTACSHDVFDESQYMAHVVRLNAVSLDGELEYPITLYAYGQSGMMEKQTTLESAADDASFELLSGEHTVAAVSGSMDFTKGYTDSPLMIGKQVVEMGKEDQTVALVLKYAVAQVDFTLTDVPENVENVSVTLKPLYGNVSPLAEYSGTATVELSCNKYDDGTWRTDTVYVLPTAGESTEITISHINSSDGGEKNVKVNTYVYPASLKASTPYHFKGSYQSGINFSKLSMTLSTEGWGDAEDVSFNFGPGAEEGDVMLDGDIYVTELPTACSVWDGHVVATIDEEGNALLFSLKEWSDITLEGDISFVATYTENSVAGWSIPTKEQASSLIELCRSSFSTLNTAIANAGGQKLQSKESRRYLCENLSMWYDLYSKRSDSSSSNTAYYLRLVKAVRFIKK